MPGSIWVLTLFFISYAFIHSLLASTLVKTWVRHTWGMEIARWYRLGYIVVGTVLLLPLIPILVWLPDHVVYRVPAPWWWGMVAVQVVALVGFVRAFTQTDVRSFLGIAPHNTAPSTLVVHGFYCWSRHPLYSFSMIILWLNPFMTSNMLTLTVLSTLYFFIGSFFEERRLRAEFGPAYTAYQTSVARFLFQPWKCKKWGFAGNTYR